jgi:hypothetical protein
VTWSVRALGRARRRLLRGRGRVCLPRSRSSPSLGSGEAETVVWGRGRVLALGSGEAEFVVFRGRARVRALGSGEAEFVVFRGRARVRALGSGEAELPMAPEARLGCCQLTLSSGTAVGAMQAALSSCQVGQWSGKVTAITSALSTDERA